MKQRFTLFRRNGTFYCEDTETHKQISLRTKDEGQAQTLLHAKNEAFRQPILNLQIARAYLTATDPAMGKRTWREVMAEMAKPKTGATLDRFTRATKDAAFDSIRDLPVLETKPHNLTAALEMGTISTNVFLRRIHNFAVDMGWLPWPILAKKQWPQPRFKEKRAITLLEHQRIIARERNEEYRAFYELCWHLGGAQSDIANLKAQDINWEERVISFYRKKTGTVCIIRIDSEVEALLRSRPQIGYLLPSVQKSDERHRASQFKRRCDWLDIVGVTLHSYRYAWAERARTCGYPERFAQEALGHNSKSVHRAYARKAQVVIPALGEFERKITVLPPAASAALPQTAVAG